MAVEDYLEPEVGVAVALTAALASPKVRGVLRRGAVYGLAGVLAAGDAVSSLARGVRRGAQAATEPSAGDGAAPTVEAAPAYVEPSSVVAEPTDGGAAETAPKRSRKTAEAASHE